MSDERTRMMAFAERWYRFGGGNHEDIMVEFGVTDAVFFARLRQLLAGSPELMNHPMGQAIDDVAAGRLAAIDSSHSQGAQPIHGRPESKSA
ncbi:hypothetical protein [Rhodococcus koreensis]|uniref:hypothetical protein n=1 Tax=Rhodococcus koreensis TaxID=99653 RepID=UPI00197F926E|nr:hypothetical protein [Rhodococcus koreensis]QSE86398.1 hypothetical protein JWS14_46265 [Rhodococcus koreensis]